MKTDLLKALIEVESPSGSEFVMKEFLLEYIDKEKSNWKVQPEIFHGTSFQDAIILKFGTPTTAVFAHMDSIGFTVQYDNELIKIGGPQAAEGDVLIGSDSIGRVEGTYLSTEENGIKKHFLECDRTVEVGTTLTYKPNFRLDEEFVQCCYMDNRLGMLNALELAETLENGVIVFSTYEEHGGGSVGFLGKYIYENWGVQQALISDITWVTKGVQHGGGVAISMRDSGIPRRVYLNRIVELAKESGIPFQLEVEGAGGSDGNQLQHSPYPFDWVFIGAPEDNVHTKDEKVALSDYEAMVNLYRYLLERL